MRIPLCLALVSLVFPTSLPAQGLDTGLREQLARSVVQVQARGCQGVQGMERRVATGFAYGPAGHVVTAAHVVAGCDSISVFWEKHGGQTQQASVARVLPRADLVLLHVGDAPGDALRAQPQRPSVDTTLETLGYYLSVPTMSNKRLRVTYGSAQLADMVPPQTRRELQASGAIDINLDILRLDGHLLPGHSGAPIFDMQGNVVGIGSGGLKSGAASISWAVPAAYLENLLASEDRQIDGQAISSLFAHGAPDDGGGSGGSVAAPQSIQIACGGVEFIYTGTRTFDELTVGHDDLGSVELLMAEFELTEADVSQFVYHTFQPLDGGAAVAIPDWTSVETTGPICQAIDINGRLTVDFASSLVYSVPEAMETSVQFENAFIYNSGRQWLPAPEYSYVGPYQRDDGLTVNRKTIIGVGADTSAISIAFETLLLHAPPRADFGTFTGVIGTYWNIDLQASEYCEYQPDDPECGPVLDEAHLAAQMILGVLLSTAPRI